MHLKAVELNTVLLPSWACNPGSHKVGTTAMQLAARSGVGWTSATLLSAAWCYCFLLRMFLGMPCAGAHPYRKPSLIVTVTSQMPPAPARLWEAVLRDVAAVAACSSSSGFDGPASQFLESLRGHLGDIQGTQVKLRDMNEAVSRLKVRPAASASAPLVGV